jgi:hypothetical protein
MTPKSLVFLSILFSAQLAMANHFGLFFQIKLPNVAASPASSSLYLSECSSFTLSGGRGNYSATLGSGSSTNNGSITLNGNTLKYCATSANTSVAIGAVNTDTITVTDFAGHLTSIPVSVTNYSRWTQWRIRNSAVPNQHSPRTAQWNMISELNGPVPFTVTYSKTFENNPINNTLPPWGIANNCSDSGAIVSPVRAGADSSYGIDLIFQTPIHLSQISAYSSYGGGCREALMSVQYYNGSSWVTAYTWDFAACSCGYTTSADFSKNYY